MIEQIQAEDFEQLFEIEQQAHLVPWSKGTLLNNQGEKYLNLKVVEQNKIVAFAISHIVLDEATLFNIAVAPDFQGKGIGKRLLSELILQLQQRKLTTLWLEVRESTILPENSTIHSVLMKLPPAKTITPRQTVAKKMRW